MLNINFCYINTFNTNMEELMGKDISKKGKQPFFDPSTLDQDAYMRFVQAVHSMTETIQFDIDSGSYLTIMMILKVWSSRKNVGNDKKVKLKLTNIKCERENIIKQFQNICSIELYIDGEEIKNNAILKNEEIMYYEGIQSNMFIFHKQSNTRYYGQVKSLTDIEPHGKGLKIEFPGTKDQISYEGDFKEGKKQGFGVQKRKYLQYQGYWEDNEKHNWGRELVKRKKKLTSKITQKSSSKNSKSEKDVGSIKQIEQITQIKEEQGENEQVKQKKQNQKQSKEDIKQEQIRQEEQIKEEEQSDKHENNIGSKKQIPLQNIKLLLKQYRSIYEGPFQKGQRSGPDGTQYTRHGTYVGQWSCGVKNGEGKIDYKTGAKYSGEWKNNFFQGHGTYTDEANNVYQGEFSNGLYDGQGCMKYANGDEYTGAWSQGRKHGQGVYTYSDGDYYDGQWVKDSAQGHGSCMIRGIFYEGQFHKGQKNGLGEQTNEEGDTIKGIWKKNQRIETISINGQVVN